MIARLLQRLKPKAKSLIITIYGDSIAHHGGSAWLGSVIRLAAPLAINDRAVRSSVFRLAKEGWLEAEQVGRRSYYRLTEIGQHRVETAHGRIYHQPSRPWDGTWTMVLLGLGAKKPAGWEALRSDLRWQGFGQIVGGILLHPDPDPAALRQALADAGLAEQVLVMEARAQSGPEPGTVRALVGKCWDMEQLAADYAAFLAIFRPVWQSLDRARHLEPETCFVVRTLLMHAYRRVLLRDPKLPDELLEANWPGVSARLLCRNLYRLIQEPAERHLMATLETADGTPPPANPAYYRRFGGLEAADNDG